MDNVAEDLLPVSFIKVAYLRILADENWFSSAASMYFVQSTNAALKYKIIYQFIPKRLEYTVSAYSNYPRP